MKKYPSQAELKDALDFNQDTGLFTWKVDRANNSPAGSVAGCVVNKQGYIGIGFNYKVYLAHRLAFIWMTGSYPKCIDHINGNTSDNRWSNLRPATRSQNAANRKRNTSFNSSGVKGVTFHKPTQKWAAQIVYQGKRKWLGVFECPLIAHVAYRKAAKELFGEFANFG